MSAMALSGRAVTVMLDNMREHTFTLEERKFEVNKLQVVCEAAALGGFCFAPELSGQKGAFQLGTWAKPQYSCLV